MSRRYDTVQEEAAALEAVVADRFPSMSSDDRAMFAAAVLYKVADLYRRGDAVVLESYDSEGRPVGRRPLVIEGEPVITASSTPNLTAQK